MNGRKLLMMAMMACSAAKAQFFETQHDTVRAAVIGSGNVYNLVTNISTSPIFLQWRITGHDFPADWSGAANLAICDNALCRSNSGNQLLAGNVFNTAPYQAGEEGDFHLMLNLSASSAGKHYLVVELFNDSQRNEIVFIIDHWMLGSELRQPRGGFNVYPNPAGDHLIVSGTAEATVLTMINSLGQVVRKNKLVQGNETVSLADLPEGWYIVFIYDWKGTMIGNKKVLHLVPG